MQFTMAKKQPAVSYFEDMGPESPSLKPRPRLTRAEQVKRHGLRWWWIYAIGLTVSLVGGLLVVIFVAYPKIAQSQITKAVIVPTTEIFANPTTNTVDLTIEGKLQSNSMFHPALSAFEASLYLEGRSAPFTSFMVPAMVAGNGSPFKIQQTVQVTNTSAVTDFAKTLLVNETMTIYLRGKGGLKLGALQKTMVNYNTRIVTKGLNNLSGLQVTSLLLSNATLLYHANSHGNVSIPNPSPSTLTLGVLKLDMYVSTLKIGNTTIPNLVLSPGNNSYPLYTTANETAIASLLAMPKYRCGILPIDLKAKQSAINNVSVPYLTGAVVGSVQSTTLDLKNTLAAAGLSALITGDCED